MTRKLNPMLKPENRVKLLLSGMNNIDILQQKTIADAQKTIKDYSTFQKQVQEQFEQSIKEYKRMVGPIQKEIERHQRLLKIDASTQKTIDDAVKATQAIEGYSKVASDQLQKEVTQIMKTHIEASIVNGLQKK
jgi:multidrug resistance efflux pump